MRKIAIALVGIGLMIGLVGAGIGASFTDSATATANIAVGTFGISITSGTSGAVVVNTGTLPGVTVHTVTLQCPAIQSSVAGSCPLAFTVTATGTMGAKLHVVSSDAFVAPWSDLFVQPGDQTLVAGGHYDYSGGIKWTELFNADLGTSHSVTYTITATQ